MKSQEIPDPREIETRAWFVASQWSDYLLWSAFEVFNLQVSEMKNCPFWNHKTAYSREREPCLEHWKPRSTLQYKALSILSIINPDGCIVLLGLQQQFVWWSQQDFRWDRHQGYGWKGIPTSRFGCCRKDHPILSEVEANLFFVLFVFVTLILLWPINNYLTGQNKYTAKSLWGFINNLLLTYFIMFLFVLALFLAMLVICSTASWWF